MRLRYLAPLAMAAAAATIGFAPIAAAAPTGCTDTGNATVCQQPGSAQIVSSPPVVSGPQYLFLRLPWYGVVFDHGRLP
jgi:hypothetical protein